jgi:hypothetical protein
MSSKQKNPRKIEEIIGELNKPSLNKHNHTHVFVEGVDDVKIYREIARKKGLSTMFTFEQQGGRIQLFNLNTKICSDPSLLNKTMLFADKDTFVFNSIPSEHENIQFTKGYSIENDLFEDGHAFLMSELSVEEKIRFENLINNVSEWYAFEIEQVLLDNSKDSKIAISGLDENIIAPRSEHLQADFLVKRNHRQAEEELCQLIKNNYKLLLRGKILFEVLLRISFDRGSDSIRHRQIEPIWNIAITEGLRTTESNCHRIIRIFENRLNSF